MAQNSIENVLSVALHKLGRMDSYKTYLDYISSEWYTSVHDLLLALEDGNAWTDLHLPGRLKLEMKYELLLLGAAREKTSGGPYSTANEEPKEQWVKYFSSEHNAYFYYSNQKDVTQWDVPTGGNIEIISNISVVIDSAKIETNNVDELKDISNPKYKFCTSASSYSLSSPCPSTHVLSDSVEDNPNHDITPRIISIACASKESEKALSSKTDAEVVAEAAQDNGGGNNEEGLVTSDPSYSMETIIVTDAYAADDNAPVGVEIISPAEFEQSPTESLSPYIPWNSRFHKKLDEPLRSSTSSSYPLKEECPTDSRSMISVLVGMGFSVDASAAALKRSGNDLPGAASLLLLSPPAYNDVITTSSEVAAVHLPDSTFNGNSDSYSNREIVQASAPPSTMILSNLFAPGIEAASSQVPKKDILHQASHPLIAQDPAVCIDNVPKKVMYAPRKKVALTSSQRPSAPNLSIPSGY